MHRPLICVYLWIVDGNVDMNGMDGNMDGHDDSDSDTAQQDGKDHDNDNDTTSAMDEHPDENDTPVPTPSSTSFRRSTSGTPTRNNNNNNNNNNHHKHNGINGNVNGNRIATIAAPLAPPAGHIPLHRPSILVSPAPPNRLSMMMPPHAAVAAHMNGLVDARDSTMSPDASPRRPFTYNHAALASSSSSSTTTPASITEASPITMITRSIRPPLSSVSANLVRSATRDVMDSVFQQSFGTSTASTTETMASNVNATPNVTTTTTPLTTLSLSSNPSSLFHLAPPAAPIPTGLPLSHATALAMFSPSASPPSSSSSSLSSPKDSSSSSSSSTPSPPLESGIANVPTLLSLVRPIPVPASQQASITISLPTSSLTSPNDGSIPGITLTGNNESAALANSPSWDQFPITRMPTPLPIDKRPTQLPQWSDGESKLPFNSKKRIKDGKRTDSNSKDTVTAPASASPLKSKGLGARPAASKAEAMLISIFHDSMMPLGIVDFTGVIVDCNARLARAFGLDDKIELTGYHMRELLAPESLVGTRQAHEALAFGQLFIWRGIKRYSPIFSKVSSLYRRIHVE
jgi:PAS domain-containing protein